MTGDDQVRFCSQCNLRVHNLSEMTPKAALKLIANSKGRLCATYYKRPERAAQPTTTPLYQIGRRASRIAAGVFSATLGLSATVATAQARSTTADPLIFAGIESTSSRETGRKALLDGSTAWIEGHVIDKSNAGVPGARVTLINESAQLEQVVTSGEHGEFRFQSLDAGTYSIKVESSGYRTTLIERIDIQADVKERVIAKLEGTELTTGDVVIAVPDNPVVRAAMNDDIKELSELLDAGADVNAVDSIFQMTALGVAAGHGNLEMVELLLWYGADANAKCNSGRTALMHLSMRSTPEVVHALITAGAKIDLQEAFGETALINIASDDNTEVLQALLDANAAVETKDKMGRTALMVAAEHGIVGNVEALIAAGANVHTRDDDGATALSYARFKGRHDVEKLLRAHGAVELVKGK